MPKSYQDEGRTNPMYLCPVALSVGTTQILTAKLGAGNVEIESPMGSYGVPVPSIRFFAKELLKEPGCYWWREEHGKWCIVRVDRVQGGPLWASKPNGVRIHPVDKFGGEWGTKIEEPE